MIPAAPAQLALFPAVNPVCVRTCWCGQFGVAGACPGGVVPGLLQPSDADFDTRIGELGGLDFDATRLRPQPPLPLPPFMPQVDGGTTVSTTRRPTVIVTLAALDAQAGVPLRSSATLHDRLHLPPAVRIGLFLTGSDVLLEDLWTRRTQWLDAFAVLRPSFTHGPTFSVWDADYALDGLYAIRRSQHFVALLQERGFPSVVNVYWRGPDDMERWQRWLRDNRVGTIVMDLQCLGLNAFAGFLRDLVTFRSGLPRDVHLVVNGLPPGRRLAAVLDAWPGATVTANLYVLASKRRARIERPDGSFGRASSDASPQDLHAEATAGIERWLAQRSASSAAAGTDTDEDVQASGRRHTFVGRSPSVRVRQSLDSAAAASAAYVGAPQR